MSVLIDNAGINCPSEINIEVVSGLLTGKQCLELSGLHCSKGPQLDILSESRQEISESLFTSVVIFVRPLKTSPR